MSNDDMGDFDEQEQSEEYFVRLSLKLCPKCVAPLAFGGDVGAWADDVKKTIPKILLDEVGACNACECLYSPPAYGEDGKVPDLVMSFDHMATHHPVTAEGRLARRNARKRARRARSRASR